MLPTQSAILKHQRTFGVSAGLVCVFVAFHQFRHGHAAVALVIGLLGVAVAVLGRLAPGLLSHPSAVWWRVLHAVGWVNTRLILGALFFLILTPISVVRRLVGWDPLALKRAPGETSRWVPSPESHRDPKHYERMY